MPITKKMILILLAPLLVQSQVEIGKEWGKLLALQKFPAMPPLAAFPCAPVAGHTSLP